MVTLVTKHGAFLSLPEIDQKTGPSPPVGNGIIRGEALTQYALPMPIYTLRYGNTRAWRPKLIKNTWIPTCPPWIRSLTTSNPGRLIPCSRAGIKELETRLKGERYRDVPIRLSLHIIYRYDHLSTRSHDEGLSTDPKNTKQT